MMPCTAPPWAKLVAVDMAQGEIRWEVPLGLIDKLAPVPIPLRWGTPFAGGPIATGGGLVFIGATADERFRAYDTQTGALLWEFDGPTSAKCDTHDYMVAGQAICGGRDRRPQLGVSVQEGRFGCCLQPA